MAVTLPNEKIEKIRPFAHSFQLDKALRFHTVDEFADVLVRSRCTTFSITFLTYSFCLLTKSYFSLTNLFLDYSVVSCRLFSSSPSTMIISIFYFQIGVWFLMRILPSLHLSDVHVMCGCMYF